MEGNYTIYGALLFASMAIFFIIRSRNNTPTSTRDKPTYIQTENVYWSYPDNFWKNLKPDFNTHIQLYRAKFPQQKKATIFEIVLNWIKGCFAPNNSWENFFYNIFVAEFFFGIFLGLIGFVIYRFIPNLFIAILTKLGRGGIPLFLEISWDLCRAFWRWNSWRGEVKYGDEWGNIFPYSGFGYDVYWFLHKWTFYPLALWLYKTRIRIVNVFLKTIWWKWFPPTPGV